MLGATDSRFYQNNTKNIYKYLPIRLTMDDTKGYWWLIKWLFNLFQILILKSYHGRNERISIKNYNDMINFYFNLIKNTDSLGFDKENIYFF